MLDQLAVEVKAVTVVGAKPFAQPWQHVECERRAELVGRKLLDPHMDKAELVAEEVPA